MAITFERTKFEGHTPEIWRGECKILPGGFKPIQDLPVGTVVNRGVPLYVDFSALTAAICKTAIVITGGTTTKPRVSKGNYFQVGDKVMKIGKTDASPSITAIDRSNYLYDTITLSSAISGLSGDDVLAECSEYTAASGDVDAVPAAPKYTPNAIVGAVLEYNGKGLPSFAVAYDAVVLYPSLACPILDEWKQGICLKDNPNILFIKQ